MSENLSNFNVTRSPLRQVLVSLACAALVASSAVGGQWLLNVRLGLPRIYGIGLVGPIISFVITAVLVGVIQYRAQQRRKARLARAQVVADCNHEIRNALQAMIGLQYPQQNLEQIEAAVKRIDSALRDLLPRVHDGDELPPTGWVVHQGRLRVNERPR